MDRVRFLENLRRRLEGAPGREDREEFSWRRRLREAAGEERFSLLQEALERAGGTAHRTAGAQDLRRVLEEIAAGRGRMAVWGADLPAGTREVLGGFDVEWIGEAGDDSESSASAFPPAVEKEIPAALLQAQVGVTGALLGVAETGSVVVASRPGDNLLVAALVSVHVVLLSGEQLVVTLGDALERLREIFPRGLPGNLAFVSGPSRSADIEQSLQVGAHGPGEVHVIVASD